MFDEFIRELRQLGQPVSVPIDMPLDDKGYFDRTCPHNECGSDFKVLFDDWRDKVPDEAAFCPKCGERAEPTEFNTKWQREYISQVAESYMSQRLNDAFQRAASRTRPQKLSGGLINIEMSVSYKCGTVPVVVPPAADDALRQDLVCEACGCRFSTLGAGYFCPACGNNSPIRDFDRTVELARKTVAGINAIAAALMALHDEDTAANFEQQLLEDQIENLVTAFQRGSEALFSRLPNSSAFPRDTNVFQRLADGSALWQRATGSGYDVFLSPPEMERLQVMIQRRHKIGHCQGMVDARYLQQSGDSSYSVGQRLVTTHHHVLQLADILEKLVTGLKNLVP